MKTFKKVIVVLIILILGGFLGIKIASGRVVSNAKAIPVEKIDLSQIEDGQYLGNYEIFPVKVSVETSVHGGKITQIYLLEHFNGKGAPAEIILERIIEKQSLQVDCISGATVSSVAIKKAVEDSLLGTGK